MSSFRQEINADLILANADDPNCCVSYNLLDAGSLIGSTELDEILFYSIGTGDNRGAMALGEFAVKKEGSDNVTIDGTEYSCDKISMVLTMFSWAWTGLYWYDKKTGQLVQSGTQKGKSETILWKLKKFVYKK